MAKRVVNIRIKGKVEKFESKWNEDENEGVRKNEKVDGKYIKMEKLSKKIELNIRIKGRI